MHHLAMVVVGYLTFLGYLDWNVVAVGRVVQFEYSTKVKEKMAIII